MSVREPSDRSSEAELRTLGRLTALLAHEVNNLMTPLAAYSKAAMQHPADLILTRRALEQAHSTSHRAGEIARTILSLASTGEQTEVESAADLRSCIDAVLRCLGRGLSAGGVVIGIDVEAGGQLAINQVALEHVLINLLLNARRAIDDRGGRIEIRSAPAEACSTWNRAPMILVEVHDNGHGFHHPQLIESRSSRNRTTEAAGHGFGLELCERLVHQAHGVFEIDNHPEGGAIARLYLPRPSSESQIRPATANAAA